MALNFDGLASNAAVARSSGRRRPANVNFAETSWGRRGFASALDQFGIISITDPNGRILHVNDAFARLSGYSRSELIGQSHAILNSLHHPSAFWADAYRTLKAGRPWRAQVMNRCKKGRTYWVDALIVPLISRNGLKGYLSVQRDITELLRLRSELDVNAELLRTIVDNFPGSVAAFDQDHKLLLCNERQLDSISCSSAAIADLPQTAEDFYRAEARRNECAVADIDAYVRNQIAAATNPAAQGIERRHSDGSVTATRTIPLTRGGFVSIATDISGFRQSLAASDQPSHDDVQSRPLERQTSLTSPQENAAFFGTPNDGQHDQRMQIETEMREALANNAFELHYQPIVNIKTRKIVGCEALIRWRHPERGLIPASEFIPVAEECGIIGQIGDWVLKTACAEASRWPDDIWIAVNISAAQFSGGNLVDKILALSKRLPASRLVLEITETLLMTDRESAAATLERLKKLGVRFAIDDFGTGFSSLSYLQSFPFDKIKIDRSFVSNTANQKRSATLRRSIIQLGYNLGMTSVAEGVETTQQLDLLRAEGCIEAQGFLFSPAVPSEKIRELFSQPL